ncbi:helix-turn-helix domain-containing protein [Paraburkholderia aspalathi]|uniref:helix-turn-helix domain-containing protein n=1 Tax=Paraburkholderia aspalathi TaxID=1324617 RepID=UPI003CB4E58E
MRVLTGLLASTAQTSPRRRPLAMQLLLEEIRAAPSLPLGLPLPPEWRLRTLCAAMMEEPGSDRTLQEWARVVGASDRTLARVFQSELNTNFAIWRRQLRLSRAIHLIGRGIPLHVVAAELGYANALAFSTMFRQALGFPPSQLAGTSGVWPDHPAWHNCLCPLTPLQPPQNDDVQQCDRPTNRSSTRSCNRGRGSLRCRRSLPLLPPPASPGIFAGRQVAAAWRPSPAAQRKIQQHSRSYGKGLESRLIDDQ